MQYYVKYISLSLTGDCQCLLFNYRTYCFHFYLCAPFRVHITANNWTYICRSPNYVFKSYSFRPTKPNSHTINPSTESRSYLHPQLLLLAPYLSTAITISTTRKTQHFNVCNVVWQGLVSSFFFNSVPCLNYLHWLPIRYRTIFFIDIPF